MKILFCGGGTAGHVSPAIAMAEILGESKYKCECAFVGRSGGEENLAIVKEGYKLYTIEIEGIRRKISPQAIKGCIKAIRSLKKAEEIIDDFKPDLIIGTGGYVCWPVIRIGIKKRIKTAIHESNAAPGLVTRLLAPKCDAVLINLKKTQKALKNCKSIRIIGNPMRQGFNKKSKTECRDELNVKDNEVLIVSFGGSLGSKRLNEVLTSVMKNYSVKNPIVRHVHGTGRRYYPEYQERYPELCRGVGKCKITPYIDNMPVLLHAADIAITRCGAITLSELGRAEVCGVLIPSPNVSGNHQLHNAKYIAENGGGILIEEENLEENELVKTLDELIKSKEKRESYAKKIKQICPQNSTKLFLDFIEEITFK